MICTHPNIPKFTKQEKQDFWAYKLAKITECMDRGLLSGFRYPSTPFDFGGVSEQCNNCHELFCWTTKKEIDEVVERLENRKPN